MPPPCCMVSAASFSMSKMPLMLSGMVPMTKQLPVWMPPASWNDAVVGTTGQNTGSGSAYSPTETTCQV